MSPALVAKVSFASSGVGKGPGFRVPATRSNSSSADCAAEIATRSTTNCPVFWFPIAATRHRSWRMLSRIRRRLPALRNQRCGAGVSGLRSLPHMPPVAWSPSLTASRGRWRVRPLIHQPHSIASDGSLGIIPVGWRVLSDRLQIYICGDIPVRRVDPRLVRSTVMLTLPKWRWLA